MIRIKPELTAYIFLAMFVAAIPLGIYDFYSRKATRRATEAVMAGEIRGNTRSRIFHIPTCPQYGSINAENLRTFESIQEALDANYRPARNCPPDAVELRELYENWDGDEWPEPDRDGPM